MGNIYSQANCVYIWFGQLPAPRKSMIPSYDARRRIVKEKVISSDYWNRVWIIQEILLARKVQVVHESGTIGLARIFALLHDRIVGPHRQFYEIFHYDGRYNSRSRYSKERENRENVASAGDLVSGWIEYDHRLIIQLDRFRDRKCEKPFDRIFSLLSVSDEGWMVEVDYLKPAVEVAYQVLSCCEGTLCVCSAALVATTLGLGDSTDSGLPVGGAPYLALTLPLLRGWRHYLSRWSFDPKGRTSWIGIRYSCPALSLVARHLKDSLASIKEGSPSSEDTSLEYDVKNHPENLNNVNVSVDTTAGANSQPPSTASPDEDTCLKIFGFSTSSNSLDNFVTVRLSLKLLGTLFGGKKDRKPLELCDFVTQYNHRKLRSPARNMHLRYMHDKPRSEEE